MIPVGWKYRKPCRYCGILIYPSKNMRCRKCQKYQLCLRWKEKFHNNIQKSDGCWTWIGPRHENGYGSMNVFRKSKLAHRISWEVHNGPIPSGLWVLHKCDNPPCVRPDHLFLGTDLDNVRDCIKKGRFRNGKPKVGSANSWSVLTEKDVTDIFSLIKKGIKFREIARQYHVDPTTISAIHRRKNWKHVERIA